MHYEGREVIVTGGTGALGTGVIGRLVTAGATVYVPAFLSEEVDRFPFRDHPSVKVYEGLDLRAEDDVAKIYGAPNALYASIHLAGGFGMGPIAETRLETWDRLIALNATTCFLCCREAVRAIGERHGRIVNVASKPVLVPTAQMTAYAASKGAVAALTLSLAEELADSGIWVNAVVPSIIDTPANRAAMPGAAFGAWPKPEQIAETVAFLASPLNCVTRGALVPVYGRS